MKGWVKSVSEPAKQAPVECSMCKKMTEEYCSGLTCRACHVSITFEDCVNGTDPETLAWKKQKAEALKKAGVEES